MHEQMGLRSGGLAHMDQDQEQQDPYLAWLLLPPLERDMPGRVQVPS